MPRLPRVSTQLIVAIVCGSSIAWLAPGAWGVDAPASQPTTTPAQRAADAPIDKALKKAADEFLYYAAIGRFDVAKVNGEKLAAAQPNETLAALDAAVEDRNRFEPLNRRINLDERLMAWQRLPDLKATATSLIAELAEARKSRALDTAFIEASIALLGEGQRPYARGLDQLRQSGERAVPQMLAVLRDPNRRDVHAQIRTALRDMGDDVVRPLLAATEMKDPQTLPWIIGALSDLGRRASVPYLARLATAKDQPETVRTAARQALVRMQEPADNLNPAELFFKQAEECYYGHTSLAPRDPHLPAYMWFWTGNTLDYREVPVQVLLDHMAMRACAYVMNLDPSRGDAVSLWIAAAYKREIDMPEGGVDKVWTEQHDKAHFFAVSAGARYVNAVLDRALNDNNAAVQMKAIKSLQEIVGGANLLTGEENRPILNAMSKGDRRVRFEAAMTVAQSLPQKAFTGQELVIPIMCEAIAQTGKAGVLVVGNSQDEVNKIIEPLNKGGTYLAKGGSSVEGAIAASLAMPAVDVIVVSESHPQLVEALFAQMRTNIRLERAAVLILVASKEASAYAKLAQSDSSKQYTLATPKSDADLAAAIEEARKRAGSLAMDEKLAGEYAVRSANLIADLAICRGQVLDLNGALPTLMGALDDARPELIKSAGNALARIDAKQVQTALAAKALDEKTADEIKICLFKNLSNNAKLFGNQVDSAHTAALTKFVETSTNLDVRSAAAEAHGALNLGPDQVKTLILGQSRK